MSFSDELREIASAKRREQNPTAYARAAQAKESWPLFVDFFYNDLKGRCLRSAKNGHNRALTQFSTFMKNSHFYDAAGTEHVPTQEERTLLSQIQPICHNNCLPPRYRQNLISQITTRFQAEGLRVSTLPLSSDERGFSDFYIAVMW